MNEQINHYQAKLAYEIDSADVADYFEHPVVAKKMIIVDARSRESYDIEHIPGAVSFPHRAMSAESVQSLDRDAIYVTYCDGIGCNASTKGALKLSTLGFQVRELMGGLDWWKRDGYSTEGSAGVKRNMHVQCNC